MRRDKMGIEEIRIRKLGDGYEYDRYEDKKPSGGVSGLTGFELIKAVVVKIERWEEEKKDKIEQEYQIAHNITQTLQTLVEGEYATKEDIRKIMQEEIAKIGE